MFTRQKGVTSRMTRGIARLSLLALLSVTCLSGCYSGAIMRAKEGWKRILLSSHAQPVGLRTPYCRVDNRLVLSPFFFFYSVSLDGYLLWRGSKASGSGFHFTL